jgi:putative ABC transport system ATP-binding protein
MTNVVQQQRPQVQVSNLCRGFVEGGNRQVVLDNLSIAFAKGECVALRGRSGSGKSTLLNLISGIDAPDQGEVKVAGQDITGMSETARTLFRREHIGFVYQAFNLISTLSVSDNLRLVLELNGIGTAESDSRIDSMLQAVGLSDRAASYPDVLSGGEQQRVAIARALIHQPALILADEPTGNLDDKTAASILQLLDRLVRQVGGTMIIATHSKTVAEYCDRVLELRDGALVGASG